MIHGVMNIEKKRSPRRLPHGNCYGVVPGRFIAGEYPANATPDSGAGNRKLEAIIRYGVTQFIDLTREDDGPVPYEEPARRIAKKLRRKVDYRRFPIPDGDIPSSDEFTREILDTIDRCIGEGGCVYLHCLGGIGRTGTIVGCFLVRHGLDADAALDRVEKYWQSTAKYDPYWTSPENDWQKEYVRNWSLKEKLK